MAVTAARALPVVLAVEIGAVTACAPVAVNVCAAKLVEAVKVLTLWKEIPVPAAFFTAKMPRDDVWALMAAIAPPRVSKAGRATVAVPCPF